MISPALFSNNNFSGSGDIAINFADDKKDYCVIDNLYKAINITEQDVAQNALIKFSNQTEPNQVFNGMNRVKSVIKTLPIIGSPLTTVGIFVPRIAGIYSIEFTANFPISVAVQTFAVAINGVVQEASKVVAPIGSVSASINYTSRLQAEEQITIINLTPATITLAALPLGTPNATITIVKSN